MIPELLKQRANAFDYLFDAVVVTDTQGIIIDWNPGSEVLYGYLKEEAVGKHVSMLHAPEDVGRITSEVMSAIERIGKWTGEVKMLRKDGSIGWVESVCVPIYDTHNQATGALGVNRDITKRVEAEHTLKRSEAKLKYEVDVKDKFFSIISHDLRGPFNALLGMTHIMFKDAERYTKDELVDYAANINEAGERVFNLLENLLEWSLLQIGGGKIIPQFISVYDLTQDAVNLLKLLAAEKNIILTNRVNEDTAYADPEMFQVVIRNLISNSLKFTPAGGTIEISSEKNDEMVQIIVTDTGMGVSREKAHKIFALDQKTSIVGLDGEVGTGLGLPLCKELIEKNGGTIWVQSSTKEGSDFRFTLPLIASAP